MKGYHITDNIGVDATEVALEAYEFLKYLIIKLLGLVISEGKLYAPQTCIPCMGINFNVKTGIMSISEEKLAVIVQICAQWADKVKTHKTAFQSLAG